MFVKKTSYEKLSKKIDKLNYILTKNNVIELAEMLGNKKEIFIRNILAGIGKGIGIGIGVTILTAILIYLLQKIVKLNIPIIGEYITDIVEIVEKNRKY